MRNITATLLGALALPLIGCGIGMIAQNSTMDPVTFRMSVESTGNHTDLFKLPNLKKGAHCLVQQTGENVPNAPTVQVPEDGTVVLLWPLPVKGDFYDIFCD
jgi:hypothetical protein